jgi:[ribosomal protein S5]-alanine N-acetyltransferase
MTNDETTYAIKLRPIASSDYDAVLKWSQNETFCLANQWERNQDCHEVYSWWMKCVTNTSKSFIRMGIEYDGKLIGYTDLANISNDSAELGIAIGESSLWGKGIGFEAAQQTFEFASANLGIEVFEAETHETNIRSRKMLERIGFEEVSRIGNEIYLGENSPLIQDRLNFEGRI